MTTNQTLFFNCPGCDGRFSQIEEPDKDLYTGEVYHCFECGDPVVFQALSFDEYVPPPTAREDCTYCNEYRPPLPRGGAAATASPNRASSAHLHRPAMRAT